jgi:hypothetical protein
VTSRWRLTAADGRVFDEGPGCLWPQLPLDLVVARLDIGRGGWSFSGYQAYGWQRYTVANPGGTVSRGWQVLGLVGDRVVVTDVNEVTGRSEVTVSPASAMTYARELLRRG